ncbi:MAG: LysR family transcriptional regulator [Acetobacteraceae bacterium]
MNASEPEWNLYRSFLAVLRERSLSAAARALNLTQPTLARHIDALEAALGLELFIRSQQGPFTDRGGLGTGALCGKTWRPTPPRWCAWRPAWARRSRGRCASAQARSSAPR